MYLQASNGTARKGDIAIRVLLQRRARALASDVAIRNHVIASSRKGGVDLDTLPVGSGRGAVATAYIAGEAVNTCMSEALFP